MNNYILYVPSQGKNAVRYTVKKKRKHFKENQLQQIFQFSQLIFVGNYFCCINLKQQVEKTQKSAQAGFPEQNILYSVVL